MNSEEKSAKRSIKKKQYSWFASELSWLTQNGLLSSEIKDRILDQYSVPADHPIDRGRLWLITFSTLGVLMFGFAVFLLICHNWNYLSPGIRTLIASGSLALFFGLGILFKCGKKGILSELSFFFTGILFGVNIWQIAQIYHFDIDFSMGFWLWGGGCLLLAVGRKLPILYYLAAAVLAIWIPPAITDQSTLKTHLYEYCPFLTGGAYSLPILAAFGYYCGRKNGWTSVCILNFLLFSWWTIFQVHGIHPENLIPFYFIFLGGLNLMAVRYIWPGAVARLARIWGALLLFFFIPFLTFAKFFEHQYHKETALFSIIVEGVVFLLLAAFWFVRLIKKNRVQESGNLEQEIFSRFLPGGFALLFVPLLLILVLRPELNSFTLCAVLSSIIMICAALWGILAIFRTPLSDKKRKSDSELTPGSRGVKKRQKDFLWTGPVLYWFGILYFILWSIFRYIDLFAESFGMPGAAGMFALIGIFLIAAGWFWSKRDKISLSDLSPDLPSDLSSSASDPLSPALEIEKDLSDSYCNSEPEPDEEENRIPFQPDRPLSAWEKIFLVFAFLFMSASLLFMIGSQIVPFRDAVKITVETAPVDPRSLFRGDYVILNYSFSTTSGSEWIDGKSVKVFDTSEIQDFKRTAQRLPRTIYTTLRFDAKKNVWIPEKMGIKHPENLSDQKVVLKGWLKDYGFRVHYGIEHYFVQEGSGRKIEKAIQTRDDTKKVLVDLWVAPSGRTRIADVRITEK
ncbi:MAG: GDYXXLXY domain-containing protein [Planctomycetia bacterium]|nr:GDYXXLXY domain-containing protein [Planctomycetia bacterium]